MRTCEDKLRYHIRNDNLFELIVNYHKKYPIKGYEDFLTQNIEDRENDSLFLILTYSFEFAKTHEGFRFWDNTIHSVHKFFGLNASFIHDWKHIDEWFKDITFRDINPEDKARYINIILKYTGIERKLLYYFNIGSIFEDILFHDFYHHVLKYGERDRMKYYSLHNRFPNDFDI